MLSQCSLRPITNETPEGKETPKTIGFWWKPPKRRLWRMKRGGFEEVSRFSRHNVAGNRLTRRCVLLPTFPAVDKKYAVGDKKEKSCWEKQAAGGDQQKIYPPAKPDDPPPDTLTSGSTKRGGISDGNTSSLCAETASPHRAAAPMMPASLPSFAAAMVGMAPSR